MACFLSQTQNEILGLYRPGRDPVVYASIAAAHNVAAHERGHKELTITSSFGRYLSALATAIFYCQDEERSRLLRAWLERGIRECWVVQESYATFSQLVHAQIVLAADAHRDIWSQLPSEYQAALAALPEIENVVRGALAFEKGRAPDQIFEWLVMDIVRVCHFVLTRAAMSVPIAEFFGGDTPVETSRFNAWIRRNAPDVRLLALSQHCTTTRVSDWVVGFMKATQTTLKAGMSLPQDQFLCKASRGLCEAAGLAYEASDAVEMQALLRGIGSDVAATGVDLRYVPNDNKQRFFRERIQLAPAFQGLTWSVDKDFMCSELRLFRTKYPGAVTSVVCEILAAPEKAKALFALHLFIPGDLAGQTIDGRAMPVRLLTVPAMQSAQSLASLALQLPHRAWAWVIDEKSLANRDERFTEIFDDASSEIYTVPLLPCDPRTETWEFAALAPVKAHPEWKVVGRAEDAMVPEILIPAGCALAIRPYIKNGTNIRAVDLVASCRFVEEPAEARYLDLCVAQVLAFGFISGIFKEINGS